MCVLKVFIFCLKNILNTSIHTFSPPLVVNWKPISVIEFIVKCVFRLSGCAIGYDLIVDLAARIHDNFPPSCSPIRARRLCTSGWWDPGQRAIFRPIGRRNVELAPSRSQPTARDTLVYFMSERWKFSLRAHLPLSNYILKKSVACE